MRRLFGCTDIVSLTDKFLMARNFFRIFTENNPVMWDSKTFGIPDAKGVNRNHVEKIPRMIPETTDNNIYKAYWDFLRL